MKKLEEIYKDLSDIDNVDKAVIEIHVEIRDLLFKILKKIK
jgi:hypothetical protein